MLPDDLPCTVVTLVWSKRLDEFIERHLGRPWSTQQNAMAGQDQLLRFEVMPRPEIGLVDRWLASPVPQCPGRLGQPDYGESVEIGTGQILDYLCSRLILPEGDLTVHVWW